MRKSLILFIIISAPFTLLAQQRTHLPYSIYGIGDITPKGFARNFAMGRSGIALSSPRYLNNINPASYNSIDSISFFFDFGLGGDFVKYKTSYNKTQKGNDLNLNNLAIGFRVTSKWSSSIGIAPYSVVGYKIQTTEDIEGTNNDYFNAEITGNGGLNQFYWNNSYKILKHLNLGVSFNYLFGNLKSTEKVTASSLTNEILITRTSYLHKLYADFGLQYSIPVKKDMLITLGGVFGKNHELSLKDRIMVSESNGNITQDEITSRSTFEFPYYYGIGASLQYKTNLTFSADYLYYDWSSTSSDNTDFKYKSNRMVRLGMEYLPGRYSQLGYLGNIAFRAGAYYDESYLELNRTSMADKGITAGIGFPFLQNRTSINISYNYGVSGTTDNRLIKENYHSFMISLTLHDWWFIQRKID